MDVLWQSLVIERNSKFEFESFKSSILLVKNIESDVRYFEYLKDGRLRRILKRRILKHRIGRCPRSAQR
jgi:hypothetical protein